MLFCNSLKLCCYVIMCGKLRNEDKDNIDQDEFKILRNHTTARRATKTNSKSL